MNMFSISFRKYRDEEKEKQLVYFDHQMQILFDRAIITSTARASYFLNEDIYLRTFMFHCLEIKTCSLANVRLALYDTNLTFFLKKVRVCTP